MQYITTTEALVQASAQLSSKTAIALDLEFDKNHYRYGFNLCLIQVTDGENEYIIDPIKTDIDLSSFFAIVEDPKIQKVAFAFGEDMRLLHHLGCKPKNVLDLGIARSLLDYPQLSLSNTLETIIGVEPKGSQQKSNWFKRPLTEDQVVYAIEDVRYLFPLKDALDKLALEKGRTEWIVQENAKFDTVEYPDSNIVDVRLKKKEMLQLTKYEWFILEQLLLWREKLAEKIAKPSYQVIHKDVLWGLVKGTIKLSDWKNQRGIFRSFKNEEFETRLAKKLRTFKAEADEQEISKVDNAVDNLSPEQRSMFRRRRNQIEATKEKVFVPIKKELVKRVGENTSTFMFSNAIMMDCASGNFDKQPAYKKELLLTIAEEIGVDFQLDFEK